MARIDPRELDELRSQNDIVLLIESYGTTLKPRPDSNEYVGFCPLHQDQHPSLHVNRAKGLWHCKAGCGGGDCIEWVRVAEGKISFKLAAQLLREKKVGRMAGHGTKAKFVPRLESPIAQTVSDQETIYRVAAYYHDQLPKNPDAVAYLDKRGLANSELIERFQIGFCDRTLGHRIPPRQTQAGAEQRHKLDALGILKQTGHEVMRGCITFPVILSEGKAGEIYGRRITKGTPENERHWYLKGPHVGVWNAQAFQASDTIILCESFIDAATFWVAGFRNVTTAYGKAGVTEEIYEAFLKHDIKRCYISFDNDSKNDPEDRCAMRVATKLMAQGIECYRIEYPLSAKDTNQYAMKLKDGNGSAHGPLQMLINKAVWLGRSDIVIGPESPKYQAAMASVQKRGFLWERESQQPAAKGKSPLAPSVTNSETIPSPATPTQATNVFPLGAGPSEALATASANPETPTAKLPGSTSGIEAEIKDNEVLITIGNRSYRIRGLSKTITTYDTMKINILVRKNDAFFVDSLDLYQARSRAHFVKEACREIGIEDEVLKRDLGKILQKLEALQDQWATQGEAAAKPREISDPDKAKALELLRSENLLDRILMDFDACGVVGEQTNKLFGYIAATSRKLDKPLAMMVQSSSAAGKSSLMEAVLGFMPPEEQITYSAMTGQSLFYMGGMNLKHKILAISEEEGIRQASYALKLLQSDGKLTIASTGKDPGTGRMETQEYHVEGPVMIFLTTTAVDVDVELMNRCTILTVNEDREQTAAILQQQRREETFHGLQVSARKAAVRAMHHNAQRLLRPLSVVNPFAEELGFLDSQTRFRRDHKKYLTLIRAIALLHQYQRELKTTVIEGQTIEYIEVTCEDILLANRLADAVLGRSIDELSPPCRRLLWQLVDLVREEMETKQLMQNEVRFTRKQIRDRYGWGQTQLKMHLDKLVEMEYVLPHKSGTRPHNSGTRLVEYELLYDGRGREGQPTLPGLIDPTKKGPSTSPSTMSRSGQNTSISDSRGESSVEHRPNITPSSIDTNTIQSNETQGGRANIEKT